MLGNAEVEKTNSWAMFSYGLLHMDTLVLADQQRLTYINSIWILDTDLKTYQKQ